MEDLTTVDEAALELMEEDEEVDIGKLAEESQEAPVVRLVNIMLTDAIKRGASDIHVEPYEKNYRVRYRIDGLLHEVMNPPQRLKDAITSRIKILAKLDIAEKRLPQDGRIRMKARIEGRMRELDFRVSVLPTMHGEKVVMRLLDKEQLRLDMTKLGFEKSSPEEVRGHHPQALRHGAGHRADGLGQDQHAVLGAAAGQRAGDQHHHRRGPGRVPDGRASTRCR